MMVYNDFAYRVTEISWENRRHHQDSSNLILAQPVSDIFVPEMVNCLLPYMGTELTFTWTW